MAAPLPLSALLSQAFVALNADFETAGAGEPPLPSLAVWSNLLQHLDDDGVPFKELVTRSRLSKRALKVAVGRKAKAGLLLGGDIVELTAEGRKARDAFRDLIPTVEWDRKELRRALERLVAQFDLEHPHHPSSYGGSDPRVTGGPGQDWKPVPRTDRDVSGLPLSALLSQAIMAFSIDFEMSGSGPLAWSACVLRLVGKAGLPVEAIPPTSVPLAGMQRHGAISIIDDRVTLTELGRRLKARYRPTTAKIEEAWRARYGVVDELRSALEALELAPSLPHYPRTDRIWF